MRKSVYISGLPDITFTICQEAKRDAGEDSYCRCFCENAGLVGVFDGCGGLGAQRHREYSDFTEAYMASRLCAGAFYDAFQHIFPSDQRDDAGTAFFTLASDYCAHVLSACKPQINMATQVRGTMVKTLPTTVAVAIIMKRGNGHIVSPIWAGDSRVYLLTAAGLAQISEDDATVPDPMDNLYEDGILQNVLCADRSPTMHYRDIQLKEPFLVFAATDGCFGYFSTPMEFEGVLLGSLARSNTATEWEERLHDCIGAVAGDDYTLNMAAWGFESFANIKRMFDSRWKTLCENYLYRIASFPLDDRISRQTLWRQYQKTYFRYGRS